MPGAIGGHDNFVHVRGNEPSLHQFINGVSFLDNPHQHFFPGLSPQIFWAVNMVTGGFSAEFGNRYGGILDITTRSGASMRGGSASLSLGSLDQRTGAAEYWLGARPEDALHHLLETNLRFPAGSLSRGRILDRRQQGLVLDGVRVLSLGRPGRRA